MIKDKENQAPLQSDITNKLAQLVLFPQYFTLEKNSRHTINDQR